ncbi:MAG: Ig-like domain-containing protein, partial [Deltaproteobacteria bacterium]|nr:Ig-like domain-containing protein [Deltaproteobacteria bacterium]
MIVGALNVAHAVEVDGSEVSLTYSPVSFAARTSSLTTTVVTFDSPPGGTLDASDWSVVDDGGASRAVASVALGDSLAVGGAAPRTATVPAGSQETALVITHEALSSTASTPRVSYGQPATGGMTAAGAALASAVAEASDGVAPEFTVRKATDGNVVAEFGEPVALADGSAAPQKEAWDYFYAWYYDLRVRQDTDGIWIHDLADWAGEDYSVDVEAGTVTFRASSSVLDRYNYSWIVFDPPGGSSDSIVDRADPPNALPAGSSAAHVGDRYGLSVYGVPAGAPPVPAGPGALSVSYSVLPPTGEAPRPAPFGGHARLGDRVVLSLVLDSVASDPPTVLFEGRTSESDAVTMSPGDGANEWTATYTVGPEVSRALDTESGDLSEDSGGEDGPVAFAASVDSVTRGTSVITHASSSTPPPVVDRAAPEILHAAFASSDEVVLTLSEHLAGTEQSIESAAHAVSSGGAAVLLSGDAGADYRELWELSKLALALASPATPGASYTVTLPASLTDEAGNPFASRTYTLEYSPVSFAARTSSLTTTVVTFDSPPGGTLDASDWSVVDDGGASRAVASVALGDSLAVGGAAPRTATVPAGSQETALVITHEALSSTASTPRVSYVPGDLHINETVIDPTTHSTPDSLPFLHGRTGIEELVMVQSRVLGPVTVTATDGISPTAESAAFQDSTHIDVTFGEPITVPDSGWAVASDSGSLAIT